MSQRSQTRKAIWTRVQMSNTGTYEGKIAITGKIFDGPASERGKTILMYVDPSAVTNLLAEVKETGGS